jgi:predicted negative regulator of RcsB-dependent stress response
LYKARINNSLENDAVAQASYQKFIDLVTAKSPEEVTANKAKLIESYNNIAAILANTEKAKAIEYFNKTLALDPANKYALDSIKALK